MVEFGCLARYFNDYRDEVLPDIINEGFSAIIHAVLDINEIPDHIFIFIKLCPRAQMK